jgi:hypothetical protein
LLGQRHESAPHDVDAALLIVVDRLQIGQRRDGEQEGNTADASLSPVGGK